ncbi:MAG: hypothetical protein KIT83_11600 [Bryobacterales bacterium]|nr:hypothetical protein [Bryobacterales bacterium]
MTISLDRWSPILRLFVWALLTTVAYAQEGPVPVSSGDTVEYCLRCHGMQTMGQIETLGRIRSLAVDAEAFKSSTHGAKSCTFCHYGFGEFPHSEKVVARRKPQCTSCHRGERYENWGFPAVKEEFDASVHKATLGDAFTCFACHDPHTFEPSRDHRTIPLTVAYSNAICMQCHQDRERMVTRFAIATAPLEATHAFLPNRDVHWRTVRCLDCHTAPNERMVSHHILPKEEAVRNCVECHSQESRLMSKLYVHRVEEERQTAGFLNSVVLNDAYVVGMTRNRYLDAVSIGLAIITLIGIFLHALGRYLARRKVRKS